MKITLIVLFLAGLTIYCKCVAVLSLPPSLIAQAASLERTQESMPQQQQQALGTKNGNKVAVKDAVAFAGRGPSAKEAALALYRNLNNLWHHQDLRLTLQKRERHTFEDDAINVGKSGNKESQPDQQQQRIETIKSEKTVLEQPPQRQNNTTEPQIMLADLSSALPQIIKAANIGGNAQQAEEDDELLQEAADSLGHEYYDLNEWLAQMPKMTDDIIVSPPLPAMQPEQQQQQQQQPHKLLQQTINNREMVLEPEDILAHIHDLNLPAAVASEGQAAEDTESHDQQQYFKPLKYWARHICRYENGKNNNCPREYYRALNADR